MMGFSGSSADFGGDEMSVLAELQPYAKTGPSAWACPPQVDLWQNILSVMFLDQLRNTWEGRPQRYLCSMAFSFLATMGGFPNGQETEL